MCGNPTWDESRNIRRVREMLGSKDGQGNRKKQSSKRHDLVNTMVLRQFPENVDEADDENQRGTNINPKYCRRNAKPGKTQCTQTDRELLGTAQKDMQVGTTA